MSKPIRRQFLDNEYKTGLPIKATSRVVLGVNIDSLHDYWVSLYEHECIHRGKPEAIKYMKALYGQAVSYSLFQPLPRIPFRKILKCGLVKDLSEFKSYLRGSVKNTRAALIVLRQFELLYTEPSKDLSTVTDSCARTSPWRRWNFIRWLRTTRRKLPVIHVKPPKDHLSSKKGPSSLPALTSWDNDLMAIPDGLLKDICRLAELFGDPDFTERIQTLKQLLIAKGFTEKNKIHSRIQVFPAGGGKTRVIAIFDYWSQRTLKSLHQAMFRNLRKIDEDATYSHASAADWLKSIPAGVDIYSYDLTAATDRIPYWIHDAVLRNHLPRTESRAEIAELVKKLLLGRDFTLSWDHNTSVNYECGQPMGAYASWAMLAYSHHCIARFCGARRNEYRIIGDDIVILGKPGLNYRKFMTSFGIEISESKSIVSYKTSKHQTGEVAKRLILDGVEISPPTASLIYKTFRDWRLAPMLFEDMVRRGWELQAETLMGLLSAFYSENWKTKIVTVLSFPFTVGNGALNGVTISDSMWEEYDRAELASLFVRYRIAILESTACKMAKDNFQYLTGAPRGADPDIYALCPEKNVRAEMTLQTIRTIRALSEHARQVYLSDEPVVPRIQDEELYYPDLDLKFLEKKYQRQQFLSNTLLNFKRMLDNGTLQSYIRN